VDRFGDYRVLQLLGRGGMGSVFLVEHTVTGGRYALKTLATGVDSNDLLRFRREAEAQGAADRHPQVARIHSASLEGSRPYLVLDYLPGGSLAQRLREGPLPPRQAAALVRDLALGVAHVHAQGLLHRDLKPDNVLFDEVGTPKVVDFGLARGLTGSSLTQTGELLGTPAWMAPEQVQGQRDLDARADVYALGGVLYSCLTGRPPFSSHHTTSLQILVQVLERAPTPPGELARDVPPALERICLRALAKARDARPPSAAALAGELTDFLEGQGAPAARRWPARVALLAGAGVVAWLAVLGLREPTPPGNPLDPPPSARDTDTAVGAGGTSEDDPPVHDLPLDDPLPGYPPSFDQELPRSYPEVDDEFFNILLASAHAGQPSAMLDLASHLSKPSRLGHLDHAEAWIRRALDIARTGEDPELLDDARCALGALLQDLANADRQAGDTALARARLAEAEQILRLVAHPDYRPRATEKLGAVLVDLGRPLDAVAHWQGVDSDQATFELTRLANHDQARAFVYLQEAAERGNVTAMWEVAKRLSRGLGVTRDPARSLAWLEQAAAGGHVKAMTELAKRLWSGRDAPQDRDRAFELRARAAEEGDRHSREQLAEYLVELEAEAEREPSSPSQMYRQARILLLLTPQSHKTEALMLLRAAHLTGETRAPLALGRVYMRGIRGVVEVDLEEARRWLELAPPGQETDELLDELRRRGG
jgi:serine/threonine protein kinase